MALLPVVAEEQVLRTQTREQSLCPQIWALLDNVYDPEIPVISIWDLGVLQDVSEHESRVEVAITPTYSGCPAMREIESDIRKTLNHAGYSSIEVVTRLSPAWSTDWMSEKGKQQLMDFGIAPPTPTWDVRKVICPQCVSTDNTLISEFGSTACKAMYKCHNCLETFDYFKCI
jgi:ring-1,2-phenylacetyl-CoA epoxidase subunit PaaD